MGKHLALIFLLMICMIHNPVYAGQTVTELKLQVEGRAPIIKNDLARTREEAVKNALEKAIMQATATILSDKFEDEKFQAMKSIMISQATQYAKNYRITSERIQQGEYIANVNVEIALSPVRDDLVQMGILQDQGKTGKTSVFLSLKGIKKHSDFSHLKTFLQTHPKIVIRAYPCRLEWQQAQFNLVISGDAQNLVVELEKTGRYSLEAIEKNQDVVAINLLVKEEVE